MCGWDAGGSPQVLRMHAQPPHPAEPALPPHLKAHSSFPGRNGGLPRMAADASSDASEAALPSASGQGVAEVVQEARDAPEVISVSGLSLDPPCAVNSAPSSSIGTAHSRSSPAAVKDAPGQAAGGATSAGSRGRHLTFKGIVFDLETSGLSKSKNRIVEIAALELESGDSMQTLVNIHPEQAGTDAARPLLLAACCWTHCALGIAFCACTGVVGLSWRAGGGCVLTVLVNTLMSASHCCRCLLLPPGSMASQRRWCTRQVSQP